jgi:hypothetical protein
MHEIKGYKIGRPDATNLRVLTSSSSHMMYINGLYNHVVCDFPFSLVILL